MSSLLARVLLSFLTQPNRLVELVDSSPRALRYVELKNGGIWSRPSSAEHAHVPADCLHRTRPVLLRFRKLELGRDVLSRVFDVRKHCTVVDVQLIQLL